MARTDNPPADSAGTITPDWAARPSAQTSAGPGPIAPAPALGIPRRRRRTSLLAVGVFLAVLGASSAYYFAQKGSERVAVVGLAQDVAWGEVIAAGDLVAVQVVEDPSLMPVKWEERSSIVGARAATDLQAGTLVTARSVTGDPVPPEGKVLIGISLNLKQLPVTPLQARDQLWLVVAEEKTVTDNDAGAAAEGIPAEVLTVGQLDSTGARTVDVLVDENVAILVSMKSAAGELSLVVVPRK